MEEVIEVVEQGTRAGTHRTELVRISARKWVIRRSTAGVEREDQRQEFRSLRSAMEAWEKIPRGGRRPSNRRPITRWVTDDEARVVDELLARLRS